jgi:hypothetical protein
MVVFVDIATDELTLIHMFHLQVCAYREVRTYLSRAYTVNFNMYHAPHMDFSLKVEFMYFSVHGLLASIPNKQTKHMK